MAATNSQIIIIPQSGQKLSPVLLKLLQKQTESLEDTEDHGNASKETNPNTLIQNVPVTADAILEKPAELYAVPVKGSNAERQTSAETKSNSTSRNSQLKVPALFLQDVANASELHKSSTTAENRRKVFSKTDPVDCQPTNEQKPLTANTLKHNSTVSTAPPSNNQFIDTTVRDIIQSNTTTHSAMVETSRKGPFLTGSSISSDIPASKSNSLSSPKFSSPPTSEAGLVNFRDRLRSSKYSILTQLHENPRPSISLVSPPVAPSLTKEGEAGTRSTGGHGPPSSVGGSPFILSTKSPSPQGQGSSPQVPGHKNNSPVQEPKRALSNNVVERKCDFKRFKKVDLNALNVHSSKLPTPPKVALTSYVDLTKIKQQYNSVIHTLKAQREALKTDADEEDDGIYADATSVFDVLPQQSAPKHKLQHSFLIPDISAEEENASSLPDDGLYVDAVTERKTEQDNVDQIYDDGLTLVSANETDKKRQQKEKAEAKKKEEKERRDREKEEKKHQKEEKARAKKEKEELQMLKIFNLSGKEISVGEGIVKQDVKDLSLKKGQTVSIVRLDHNPPTMWLIRTDTIVGYVSSNNIDIDPAIIRKTMTSHMTSDDKEEEDSIYDVVA